MDAQLYQEFDAVEDKHWWFLGRREVVLGTLRRLLPRKTGNRILDVGCGTGGMLRPLTEFGAVEGLDSEPVAVEAARRRLGDPEAVRLGRLPEDVPHGRSFDLITALDVIEHLEAPVPALQALRGVLAPGGRIVVTVPAFPFLWSKHDEVNHHHRRYTRRSLESELSQAGLEISYLSHYNSLLFLPAVVERLLSRLRPESADPGPMLELPPAPVNAALRELFAAERLWIPRVRVPWGVSLIAVARARLSPQPPRQ